MKIELIKSQNIALTKLETNKGQIEGLPKNPRLIKDAKFEKLKKSIEDNPEMLGMREVLVYPYGSKFVIIGGNMRFQACKDLGFTEVPCKILDKETTAEQLRAITIKDNVGFGEHDWELLANEWDSVELEEWGIELPEISTKIDDEINDLSSTIKNLYRIEIICKDEEEQENNYNKLLEQGYECRLLTL
jgi:ParB-like chromosome segregation protein Spo0J